MFCCSSMDVFRGSETQRGVGGGGERWGRINGRGLRRVEVSREEGESVPF